MEPMIWSSHISVQMAYEACKTIEKLDLYGFKELNSHGDWDMTKREFLKDSY